MFKEPTEEVQKRLSPMGIKSLLDTLKDRRAGLTAQIDKEIKFYENLLEKKEADHAKASGSVRAS